MGHGSRLFQRRQRLDLQILIGPILGLFLVHPKKLGAGSSSVGSFADFGTENAVDSRLVVRLPGTKSGARRFQFWRCPMSKEKPTDDPRQQTDWGSHKQTDKPWKGNPEKEQQPGSSKPDLEKWHETNTH
jgi:hypothetical protein